MVLSDTRHSLKAGSRSAGFIVTVVLSLALLGVTWLPATTAVHAATQAIQVSASTDDAEELASNGSQQ